MGYKNLGVCVLQAPSTICFWSVLNVPAGNLCAGTLQALGKREDDFEEAGVVLIEKQSRRSAKMLAIAAYIEAFFTMRGKRVIMYSPVNKLAGTGLECSGANNYRARKKAAVTLTREFLAEHPQQPHIEAVFAGLSKKDDAADALLQALAYLRTSKSLSRDGPQSSKPLTLRKPSARQVASKKFSKANLMWLLRNEVMSRVSMVFYVEDMSEAQKLERCVSQDKALVKAVKKHFVDVEACVQAYLSLSTDVSKSSEAGASSSHAKKRQRRAPGKAAVVGDMQCLGQSGVEQRDEEGSSDRSGEC